MAMLDPINKVIMQEIGLTIDSSFRVIDQDTRQPIMVNDKVLKYSSNHAVPVRNQEQLFDPIQQRNQMNVLFDYFIGKMESEGTPVDLYYDIHDGSAMEVKSSENTLVSADYNIEQLKYVDIMMQLNGSSADDVKKHDAKNKPVRTTRSKKAKVDFTR